MQIFSASNGDLKSIGINEVEEQSHTLDFPWEKNPLGSFLKKGNENIWMILLWEKETLYNTSLQSLNTIRENIWVQVLALICSKLTSPKWAQKRSWIQNQMWKNNFNINIIAEDPIQNGINHLEISKLQKKICLWVHETLKNFLPENQHKHLEIKYPFHYSYKLGKIAWHLVQRDGKSMRIWIGINSDFAPVLPKNDEMAEKIYFGTSWLKLQGNDWWKIAWVLIKNIIKYMNNNNIHNDFENIINLKHWDSASIYKDLWNIHFWSKVSEWRVDIDDLENGKISVWWKVFDYWYGHLIKN